MVFPKGGLLLGREAGDAGGAGVAAAQIEALELGGGVGGGSGAVLDGVGAARLHARGGEQRETAAEGGGEGIGEEVVA